jgi:hypothetical protein
MSQPVSYRTVKADGLSILSRSGTEGCANDSLAPRTALFNANVRAALRPDFRSLSPRCARLPGLRTQRLAGPEKFRVYVRPLRRRRADDPRHFVERSPMLSRDSKDVEHREVSRFAPRFHIEFRSDAPMNFAQRPSVGSIPLRKSRLPVSTASTQVPNPGCQTAAYENAGSVAGLYSGAFGSSPSPLTSSKP